MISRVSGELIESDLTEIVVDCNGIGYGITVPLSTYDQLPAVGNDVSLYTELSVREDSWQLFGFLTHEERRLFRLLTTISGIGPKLALNVLSALSVEALSQAIRAGDVKTLSKVNGLGKRSAERLVVELKERISQIESPAAQKSGVEVEAFAASTAQGGNHLEDAITGLEQLGFKREKAQQAVQQLRSQLPEAEQTAENLIRKALAQLNS